ncbi:XIAP-associated factor 1 isoform X2 [Rhineura floridana]|uniref:XIAP-associated factor 1 isoform X2 n=1 Tax=Rhineura floridana TaxID=261503 RepID=UPI002AC86E70|nr:XIAP-associated factor 1 isoform X2 [Rhineura floridana]
MEEGAQPRSGRDAPGDSRPWRSLVARRRGKRWSPAALLWPPGPPCRPRLLCALGEPPAVLPPGPRGEAGDPGLRRPRQLAGRLPSGPEFRFPPGPRPADLAEMKVKVNEGASPRSEMEAAARRVCKNCQRDVVASNFALHEAHCVRFLSICPKCEELIALRDMPEHLARAHQQAEECRERLAECRFCELEMPFCRLQAHLDACGSRTTLCWDCGKYIMYKALKEHRLACRPCERPTGPGIKANLCQRCKGWFPDEKYLQHLDECTPLPRLLGAPPTHSSTESGSPPTLVAPSSPTLSPAAEMDVRPKRKEKELASTGRPSLKPSRSKKTPARLAFSSTVPQAMENNAAAATAYDQLVTCSQCNILLPSPTLQKHEKKCRRAASLQALRRSPRFLRKGEESM